MGTILLLQLAALAWFASPRRIATLAAAPRTLYPAAAFGRPQHLQILRKQCANWRLAAAASAGLCVGLIAALSMAISRPAVAIRVLEVDQLVPGLAAMADVESLEAGRIAAREQRAAAYVQRPAFMLPDAMARFHCGR